MATPTDVSRLSLEDLNLLIEDALKRRDELVAQKRQQLMAELQKLDAMSQPVKAPSQSRKRASAQAKYRSKKNPAQEWSGRGSEPAWLKAEREEAGLAIDAFKL